VNGVDFAVYKDGADVSLSKARAGVRELNTKRSTVIDM
jgi:hypothetical protein